MSKPITQWVTRMRSTNGGVFAIAAVIVALILSGCATRPPARYGGPGSRSVLRDDANHKLAVLEFGEFGSYTDPTLNEVSNAINLVKRTERPLLVIYIHGWHNDVTSDDVGRFDGFLSRLAKTRQVIHNRLNVVGIYFGWPGESLRVPIINTFTFWGRKRTAERIASNGDCLDAIEQLSRMARLHRQSYTVLIGHSFGGLIVERTVAHTVRTLQGQNVKPPWDLALILNPASDAVLARQLVASLDSLYRYDPHSRKYVPRDGRDTSLDENQPTVVELQADNDRATGLTFPLGSKLGSMIGGHWAWDKVPVPGWNADGSPRAVISERQFSLTTPGNNRYLVNYAITPIDAQKPVGSPDAFDYDLLHNPKDRVFYTSAPRDSESGAQAVRRGVPESAVPAADWRSWQIRYAGDVNPDRYGGNVRVPFWIVRVPSHIINDHGGIWSDNNMALMATIFRLHRPLATTPVTVFGRRVLKETVPSAAKPYVLPARPELERQRTP
jgi:pimeloyl-ACP methyl ester carboxylesterase